MNEKEFAQQLQNWKQELTDEVVSHYRAGNDERGRLAFERWKERFTTFLKGKIPSEAVRFEEKMRHFGFRPIPGEHPYKRFMREDGNTCFAFIDDLAESALKGRIGDLQETPSESRRMLTGSPRVFLSYAHEDIASARRLVSDLRESGADVWFGEDSLLPGQKWKPAIRQAIKDCRFFLALLSAKSVNKKGYVQKEMKEALEVLDEYPDSAIYVIPARLDACTPSDDKLHDLRWVNMFPDWDDGLARILKAIESQM
jgi:hypothetical protein